MLNKSVYIFIFLWISCLCTTLAQSECKITTKAFSAKELLTYRVYYNWGFIWIKAGEVSFGVRDTTFHNKPAFHFNSKGFSYPHYDWFFKVRDTYQAIVDTSTLKPYRFIRDVQEGGYYVYYDYYFNYPNKTLLSYSRHERNQQLKSDTIHITSCTFDVLSMVYYSRCIDFSKYQPSDTIPITLIISEKVYHLQIKYLGKESLETEFGTFNCIKFNPLLVSGTVFSSGDGMVVWVTDDENKMPIYVESPIVVGSVKVKLLKYKGLKYPLKAKHSK